MIWKESLSLYEKCRVARKFVEEKFKEIYPYSELNGEVLFSLPDGYTMKVLAFGGKFNSLVMSYNSDDDCDDGDMYFVEDYNSPEDIFTDMYEETMR